MRLDAQHERELERRKGLACRTIVGLLWFGLCLVVAYFFVDWLFDKDYLNYNFFYNSLFIPRSWDEWIIFAGIAFVVVFIMNFLLLLGYGFFSVIGRRRPGTASMYSSDPDPDDHRFDYR